MKCKMCNKNIHGLICGNKNCMQEYFECSICKDIFTSWEIYEYRGAYACEEHIDKMRCNRESERMYLIEEESNKTKAFKNIDIFSDDAIGEANRKLLKTKIEIASKESTRLQNYERPKK
jgi:hypothetical protein|tara:strand:+ start:2095 stop:2451 length:357 start_codon:yes stop_codon:yes gene_type:complete